MSKILYLPMEIASRELDARLLLTVVALAQGFETVIGQKWLIERNIKRMPPGIYLSKTMTQRDARSLAKARAQGYFTAAIDEELPGLVTRPDELRWISRDAINATDLVFVSGDHNTRSFISRFPEAKDKVCTALNPRWDLLRSTLRPIFDEEVRSIRKTYGDFILINSNLGFINSEKGTPEELFNDQVRLGKLDADNAEHTGYVKAICDMELANKAVIIEIVAELRKRHPDRPIVLRPHPSERIATWTDALKEHTNVSVVREGSAVPWIMAAAVLIHTNCTTGTEAIALEKPAICVLPTDSPVSARYLSNRVNPVARSTAEALALTDRALAGDRLYSAQMIDAFKRAMSFEDDHLGAQTIIEAMVKKATGQHKLPERRHGSSSWRPTRKYLWHMPDRNVRGDLFPNLDLAGVERRLVRIAQALGITLAPNVEYCGSKMLLIGTRRMGPLTRLRRSFAGKSVDFRDGALR
jgi:surface carbohydrate biosynthesis protein